jgi:hypothetical protein
VDECEWDGIVVSGLISPRVERYWEHLENGGKPATALSTDPTNEQLLENALTELDGTKSGREVSQWLRRATADGDVKLVVMDDVEYYRKYPGTGGVYNRASDTLTLPRISLTPVAEGATFLAHEGQHAMDDAERAPLVIDKLQGLASGVPAALKGLLQLKNPLSEWGDEVSRYDHLTEVNGYTRQAEVAIELGDNQYGWNIGYAKDGTVVPRKELADKIENHPLYAYSSTQRALNASVPTLLVGLGGSMVGSRLLGKVPQLAKLGPNKLSMISLAATSTVMGGLLVQDYFSHKAKLETIRR